MMEATHGEPRVELDDVEECLLGKGCAWRVTRISSAPLSRSLRLQRTRPSAFLPSVCIPHDIMSIPLKSIL